MNQESITYPASIENYRQGNAMIVKMPTETAVMSLKLS